MRKSKEPADVPGVRRCVANTAQFFYFVKKCEKGIYTYAGICYDEVPRMGKGIKDMTKKQLEKMDRVQFLNKALFKVAQAHADRQYLWDETEFTKLIRAWEDAHNVYGVIEWEDLYDGNGDYMGIRVEDDIIYQSEYRDEHPEIFN